MISRAFGKTKEARETDDTSQSRVEVLEIIEAFILALVAVATAWSGYQAAEWAGKRAQEYSKADRLRVTAEGLATLAGQERIYDSDTFNSWLAAKLDSKKEAAEFFRAALSRRVPHRIRSMDEHGPIQQRASASGPDLHARVSQRQARAVPCFE
jgi:hypothetical protein